MSADLVFLGGRIHTVDATDTIAQAVAVSGRRIAAVGSDADVRALVGPKTQVVELAGRSLLPGFIDAHCHRAYAAFDETLKGSVEVGKLADLVVLAEDVSRVPAERVRHVGVTLTVLGGEVVYSAR